jgi:hypothetical protein
MTSIELLSNPFILDSYQLINTSTKNVLIKIQLMTNVNLLHVPEPGCHPQGVCQIKGVQSQPVSLSVHHSHWND